MNDKTKRIILITVCCLLCGAAVIGIAGRFGGNTVTPSGTVSGSQPDSNDPNVNINSQGDVNVPSLTPEQSDPGQVANSNGTEQTIQPDPVKPEYTEDELKDPTKTPDGTPVEGSPEPQDHNNVTPPPEQPSTNTSGGLPGFDNVPNAGANQGGSIDSDGDINTQVGIMG